MNAGKAEIACGHHRIEVLRREYGPNHKVDLSIKRLSDDAMFKMMARENQDEFDTKAVARVETELAFGRASRYF